MVVDIGHLKKVTIRIITFIISLIGIYFALKMAVFYMPFLIAFIISTMAEPCIKKLSNKAGINRKTSAIIVLVMIFIITLSALIWGIIMLIDEGSNLLLSMNEYIEIRI